MASEKAIQNDILVAITAEPGVMAWRNNTGMAWVGTEMRAGVGSMVRVERGMVILREARPLKAGLPGSPDIIGCANGRGFGIEVKTRTGSQSDQQVAFQRAWTRVGGLYVLARSVDDARDGLSRGA